jgi:hypothetical protein
MNSPFNQNDPYGDRQGPVIIPPQGNPQGIAPPSSGAVRLFCCTIFMKISEMFCYCFLDGLSVLSRRISGFTRV